MHLMHGWLPTRMRPGPKGWPFGQASGVSSMSWPCGPRRKYRCEKPNLFGSADRITQTVEHVFERGGDRQPPLGPLAPRFRETGPDGGVYRPGE